jgi:hypothetical protein
MSWIQWNRAAETKPIGGLAGWLAALVIQKRRPAHRLELIERITLAPRQSLALIEAEGMRLLVATSAEGPPAFYNLNGHSSAGDHEGRGDRGACFGTGPRSQRRVSW